MHFHHFEFKKSTGYEFRQRGREKGWGAMNNQIFYTFACNMRFISIYNLKFQSCSWKVTSALNRNKVDKHVDKLICKVSSRKICINSSFFWVKFLNENASGNLNRLGIFSCLKRSTEDGCPARVRVYIYDIANARCLSDDGDPIRVGLAQP